MAIALACLTALSGYLRLRNIDNPRTPIFDESYAGVIVNNYRLGKDHFFDLHPPFSRLLQYFIGVFYLQAPECAYSKDMHFVECDMWQMRLLPCILGTLLVPLTYATLRLHRASQAGALFGAFLVASDNMFFTLSRIHLMDMITMFSIATVAYFHERFLRSVDRVMGLWLPNDIMVEQREPNRDQSLSMAMAEALLWVCCCGACLGCAVSSKFGVAGATAIWCVVSNGAIFWRWWRLCNRSASCDSAESEKRETRDNSGSESRDTQHRCRGFYRSFLGLFIALTSLLAIVAFSVYFAFLVCHFSFIPWKDAETGSYASYALTKKRISAEPFSLIDRFFESFLLRYVNFSGENPHSWCKIVEYTIEQYYYYVLLDNYELEVPRLPNSHHSHSQWTMWLLAYRGLMHALFPRHNTGEIGASAILFLPNVISCWLTTVCTYIASLIYFVRRLRRTKSAMPHKDRGLENFLVAYFLHLLPFLSVHRELFIIYYTFAYYFGLLFTALLLDRIATPLRSTVMSFIVAICSASFLYMWPLSTGEITSVGYLDRMAMVQPSCWYGRCFNAPDGSPLASLYSTLGSDRALFPFLVNGTLGF